MEDSKPVRGRFAPSPSGRMHLGNVFAALLAWLDVRAAGGELLLRMEDLDPDRCRRSYTLQLADDLLWLGLTWDLGWKPESVAFCQSHRTAYYEDAFQRLARENFLYPCYCSRKEFLAASAPHASDGHRVYTGICRNRTEEERAALQRDGRRPAWRIQVPHDVITFHDGLYGVVQEVLDRDCGDFILRRSDGVYAYQLAVVEDDARMGITRVVRGRDLLSSTPRQIWLAKKLGHATPSYCHVPLLLSQDGRRLSKRDQDLDMGVLRSRTTPQKVLGFLAYTAGLLDRPEPVTAQELIDVFSWSKINTEDKRIDCLTFLNTP